MRYGIFIPFLALMVVAGCDGDSNFSNIPEISYVSIQPKTIIESRDSTIITFSFKDGDGDLGLYRLDGEDTILTVLYVVDSRIDKVPPEQAQYLTQAFAIDTNLMPTIKKKAILGTMSVEINDIPMLYYQVDPISGAITEKMNFRLYLYDRENNISNIIETDSITLIRP